MNPRAYLTVVSTIYHQPMSGQPSGVPRRFSLPLMDDMPPCVRRIVDLDENWRDVDYGWIDEPSCVEIFNEGTHYQQHPSDEEKIAATLRIIEIGVNGTPVFQVRPLCAHSGEPLAKVQLRCRHGKASCVVTVWPK